MLPKTSIYVKGHEGQTKWMYFLIEDDDLLEKYNTIWDKISADIRKKLGFCSQERWKLFIASIFKRVLIY